METMTEPGTETRIGELSKRVDFGFEQVDHRFDRVEGDLREIRADMKAGFDKVEEGMKAGFEAMDAKWDAKFDSLNRTIIYLLGGSLSVALAAIFAAFFHAAP